MRTRGVGIFPNVASALRLITMILIEQTEDWTTERRYVTEESMQKVLETTTRTAHCGTGSSTPLTVSVAGIA